MQLGKATRERGGLMGVFKLFIEKRKRKTVNPRLKDN